MQFLADDSLEGRETGSEGLRKAQAYVVDQFKKAGLEPAGTDGFYQPVKFVSREIVESESSAALISGGKAQPLVLGDDAYFSTRANLSPDAITAKLVFVGYGLKIPEQNYDDLAGLDLKGKIVVYIAGSPADTPTALSAHYQTALERWKSLKAAGVIGTIAIPNPASMDIPWSRIALSRTHPSMDLVGKEFDETAGLKLVIDLQSANAEKLFAGSGHTFAEIAALGKDRNPMPHFPLAVSLKAHATMKTKAVESANLVAKLPGSDPTLKSEYVVLSAHLDHIGVGEPINGDKIYNGAMDNASGASAADGDCRIVERSAASEAFTAFCRGDRGGKGIARLEIFRRTSHRAGKSIVADVNIDMFLPIVPIKVLKVQGIDRVESRRSCERGRRSIRSARAG